ncbi:lamin-A-like [Dicentrarchus labrax]|uniref:lamin-A-like n=1 Tax=Dicentrarchus labrax TaxID=13489 RepID=UPI0021F58ED2|nr:lamin-A-like [Dicentrarchus labrax]
MLNADTKLLKSHPTPLIVLVFHLLLTHFCRGQFQLIGSSQPIVATLGHDIILPCHLDPAEDASGLTLEWTRADLNPRFVHVWRDGQELESKKHPSFEGRTSLFIDELKLGNISLKVSKVKIGDQGTYRCFIPSPGKQSSVQLVVAAVFSPVLSLAGIDKDTSGVVLQCESKGWYPEPEVVWLDGEGNLLSAGPTETVRGPDDLYTVSSRVTVEKRHSNNFTCRVQQKNINQTRETHIYISDDFFEVQSSSFTLTVGLAVSLAVCILLILLLVFFVWKWRQNIIINKGSHWGDSGRGEERNCSKRNKTEDQRETLMADETVQMEVLNEGKGKKKNKHLNKQKTEQQRREEAENRVKRVLILFSEELETRKNEKQDELQQLREERQRHQNNLQTVKKELENKNKELQTIQAMLSRWPLRGRKEEEQKKNKAEQEVETLKKKMETHQKELDIKIKQVEDKQAEVQQLQDEIQRMETNLRTLMENLESNNKELERSQAAPVRSPSSWLEGKQAEISQLLQEKQNRQKEVDTLYNQLETKNKELDQKLWHEQQRAEKAEKDLKELKIRNKEWEKKFKEEKKKRKEAERKVENSNKEPEPKYIANRCEVLEENDTSSTNQSSITAPDVEVDPQGKYIRLRNSSNEEQQLGGWRLGVRLNETKPIMYTFENSFKLQAGNTVTLWASGSGGRHDATDRVWMDLKSWRSGDKLQVTLISNTGDIHYNLKFMS